MKRRQAEKNKKSRDAVAEEAAKTGPFDDNTRNFRLPNETSHASKEPREEGRFHESIEPAEEIAPARHERSHRDVEGKSDRRPRSASKSSKKSPKGRKHS